MAEKKKKVVTYFNLMAGVRWVVGGATCLNHLVRALKAAYFRIRKQIFWVSI